jgi:hypothetical protein
MSKQSFSGAVAGGTPPGQNMDPMSGRTQTSERDVQGALATQSASVSHEHAVMPDEGVPGMPGIPPPMPPNNRDNKSKHVWQGAQHAAALSQEPEGS